MKHQAIYNLYPNAIRIKETDNGTYSIDTDTEQCTLTCDEGFSLSGNGRRCVEEVSSGFINGSKLSDRDIMILIILVLLPFLFLRLLNSGVLVLL